MALGYPCLWAKRAFRVQHRDGGAVVSKACRPGDGGVFSAVERVVRCRLRHCRLFGAREWVARGLGANRAGTCIRDSTAGCADVAGTLRERAWSFGNRF